MDGINHSRANEAREFLKGKYSFLLWRLLKMTFSLLLHGIVWICEVSTEIATLLPWQGGPEFFWCETVKCVDGRQLKVKKRKQVFSDIIWASSFYGFSDKWINKFIFKLKYLELCLMTLCGWGGHMNLKGEMRQKRKWVKRNNTMGSDRTSQKHSGPGVIQAFDSLLSCQ